MSLLLLKKNLFFPKQEPFQTKQLYFKSQILIKILVYQLCQSFKVSIFLVLNHLSFKNKWAIKKLTNKKLTTNKSQVKADNKRNI